MGVNCEEIISKRKYMDWGLIRFIFVVLCNFFHVKNAINAQKKRGLYKNIEEVPKVVSVFKISCISAKQGLWRKMRNNF